jgi:hypothetical protein
LPDKNNIWSGGVPWKQGWKTAADIGRIASKHVKVTVSGKNSLHSSSQPAKTCSATLKKAKPTEAASTETMNHTNDKDIVKDEVEAMDTQEGGSRQFFAHFGAETARFGPGFRLDFALFVPKFPFPTVILAIFCQNFRLGRRSAAPFRPETRSTGRVVF